MYRRPCDDLRPPGLACAGDLPARLRLARDRWGWNPQDRRYERDVDAIFELRNTRSREWQGAVRSLHCTQDIVQGNKRVVLQPGGTSTVKFVTSNCGTRERPSFRPNITTSHRID